MKIKFLNAHFWLQQHSHARVFALFSASYYKKSSSAKNIYVLFFENPLIYLICQRTCLPGRTIKRTVNTPQGKQWFPERQLFQGRRAAFFQKNSVFGLSVMDWMWTFFPISFMLRTSLALMGTRMMLSAFS